MGICQSFRDPISTAVSAPSRGDTQWDGWHLTQLLPRQELCLYMCYCGGLYAISILYNRTAGMPPFWNGQFALVLLYAAILCVLALHVLLEDLGEA